MDWLRKSTMAIPRCRAKSVASSLARTSPSRTRTRLSGSRSRLAASLAAAACSGDSSSASTNIRSTEKAFP